MRRVHITQDQLDYVGLLTVPMFHLFTGTSPVASGLYYAFLGLHSGADAITVDTSTEQPSQMNCAIALDRGETWRLSLERVDWTLPGAYAWELNSDVLARGDSWLRNTVRGPLFRHHYLTYTAHVSVEDGTAQDVISALGTPTLNNFGTSYGTGAIYHVYLAPSRWTVQVTIDYSQQMHGHVFFQMIVGVEQDALDYTQVGVELSRVMHAAFMATGMNVVQGVG